MSNFEYEEYPFLNIFESLAISWEPNAQELPLSTNLNSVASAFKIVLLPLLIAFSVII